MVTKTTENDPKTGSWHKIERVVSKICRVMNNIGIIFLMLMMLLITADVLLRIIFNISIIGKNEICEFMMIIVVYFAIAYTQIKKGHVSVDVLMSRFRKRVRFVVENLTYLFSLTICVLISWRSLSDVKRILKLDRVSDILYIPVAPFQFAMAIGFILFSIVLLIDLIHSIRKTFQT